MSKVNADGMLLFEQPFVRVRLAILPGDELSLRCQVPYENYRKVFRVSQKNVERELGAVQSMSSDIATRSRSGEISQEEVATAVDGMIGRVEALKRKVNNCPRRSEWLPPTDAQLSELHETSGKPTQDVLRERLQHLATVENAESTSTPEFSRWADARLDRWLVDWALRNGKERTARQIACGKNIEVRVSAPYISHLTPLETDPRGYRSVRRHSTNRVGACPPPMR